MESFISIFFYFTLGAKNSLRCYCRRHGGRSRSLSATRT